MITEDYCSFEVARLLKKKGFDERSRIKYCQISDNEIFAVENEQVTIDEVYIPTHQMAMKWLRENKGLFINIGQFKCMNTPIKYRFSIWKDVTYIGKSGDTGDYPTFEDAVEAALKYAIKNLI